MMAPDEESAVRTECEPLRSRYGCADHRGDEVGRLTGAAEQRLDHRERRVVVGARRIVPDRLSAAVREQQALVVAIERVAGGVPTRSLLAVPL
jgi:hypothetical protein